MNFRTANWTHVASPDGLFCCGHTFLDTGDLVIVGGHQANAGYPVGGALGVGAETACKECEYPCMRCK